jgi:hypothetical protein
MTETETIVVVIGTLLMINIVLYMVIISKINSLIQGDTVMASDLTAITAQVAANTTVIGSAMTLLGQLSDLISSLKNDPVALQALADQLKTQDDALAAAITANTPAQ